jgi:hypothetical protein
MSLPTLRQCGPLALVGSVWCLLWALSGACCAPYELIASANAYPAASLACSCSSLQFDEYKSQKEEQVSSLQSKLDW